LAGHGGHHLLHLRRSMRQLPVMHPAQRIDPLLYLGRPGIAPAQQGARQTAEFHIEDAVVQPAESCSFVARSRASRNCVAISSEATILAGSLMGISCGGPGRA